MNNKARVDDWRVRLAYPLFWLLDVLLNTSRIAEPLFDLFRRPDRVRAVLESVYVNKAAVDDELEGRCVALQAAAVNVARWRGQGSTAQGCRVSRAEATLLCSAGRRRAQGVRVRHHRTAWPSSRGALRDARATRCPVASADSLGRQGHLHAGRRALLATTADWARARCCLRGPLARGSPLLLCRGPWRGTANGWRRKASRSRSGCYPGLVTARMTTRPSRFTRLCSLGWTRSAPPLEARVTGTQRVAGHLGACVKSHSFLLSRNQIAVFVVERLNGEGGCSACVLGQVATI
jgi:hypothetical protein